MGFNNCKKPGSSSPSHVQRRPGEETPLLVRVPELSSHSKTFANIFLTTVGAGVLGIPYTFKKTGWLLGLLLLFFVSALNYRCMMLLVCTRRKLESVQRFTNISSFGDVGYAVCGHSGRFIVDLMIVLTHAGFCVCYLIFISNTLANCFNKQPNEKLMGFPNFKPFFIWICFPFQLGMNSIPTLTRLARFSSFASAVDLGAIGVVMVENIFTILENYHVVEAFGGFSVVFYGIGVAIYTLEGVGMVLPLESECKDKQNFGRLLALSLTLISLIYVGFGVLGYFAFGADTQDIITTNLGPGPTSMLVQIGLCVSIFFSFPLMMNPVYEIMQRRFCDSRYSFWLRSMIVFSVTLVALLVPNFADFLSLVGSCVCCSLGLVLPSLFHLMVFKKELSWIGVVSDVLILVFGVVSAVVGTWTSLLHIFV